ncbi:MAG: ABC transporter ATP-binding protein [Coleofasciculus sp. G3-WIS-01]|uniref:energy-coupling factor ABC transporter ATP-binding protein n=1 Tax=Coleofasciculus sp. G3-WIS-01 TaxID=3069528 RepID=UPI0032FB17EE
MTNTLLHFQEIIYTYPGQDNPIFVGLNLSIVKNKKTAIIGQNGSGKSTLFLLADGLHKVQKGKIYWKNEELKYNRKFLNRWRQRIGLAFQDPEQQLVAGTVIEDIAYGLANLQLPKAEFEQRLDDAIADFVLQELVNLPLHNLSLGQKRRVALAGVMALKPELLLLDEPTAYLDRRQTQNFMQELDRIHESGTTVVLATHDLDIAYQWADWFLVLHQGQLVMEGEAEAVFSQQELIEELQLGLPTVWQVWQALPKHLRCSENISVPRTVSELNEKLSGTLMQHLSQSRR